MPTYGIEYYTVSYRLSDGSIINIHIRDTCGQEKFNSINKEYYKKADGILLVYDITRINTFDKIKKHYIKEIKDNCEPDIPIILLGNKTDLHDKREVV